MVYHIYPFDKVACIASSLRSDALDGIHVQHFFLQKIHCQNLPWVVYDYVFNDVIWPLTRWKILIYFLVQLLHRCRKKISASIAACIVFGISNYYVNVKTYDQDITVGGRNPAQPFILKPFDLFSSHIKWCKFCHQLPSFHVCEASRLRHGRVLWRDGGPTHGNLVGFWGSVVDNPKLKWQVSTFAFALEVSIEFFGGGVGGRFVSFELPERLQV